MRCIVCDYTGNKNQEQSHYHRSLKIRNNKGSVSFYPDLKDYFCMECAGSILSSLKQQNKEDKNANK